MKGAIERLRRHTEEAGRSFDEIGLEPQLNIGQRPPAEWHTFIDGWKALGATHLCLTTMKNGFTTPQQHIDALENAARELSPGSPG